MKRAGILRDASGDSRDLWFAIALAISFAIYHVMTTMTGSMLDREDPLYQVLSNGLMLWIFGLLWISYRRWHEAGKHRAELHALMRSITTEAILLLDPERRVRDCNDAVARLFARSPDEICGEKTDLLYGDRRQDRGDPSDIRRALDEKGFHIGRAIGFRSDGETFPLEISTAVFKGRSGAVLVMRDITDRLRAESEILAAKNEAEAAYKKLRELEKLRNGLTHMVIHDMRTPLQVMMTSQELLNSLYAAGLSPDAKELLVDLSAQTSQLAQMANAVLDVSRMEEGQMPLAPSKTDLCLLVANTLQSVAGLTRHHRISVEGPVTMPINCDADIVQRVMANLVVNAVKYTPVGGSVTVRVQPAPDAARVEIADTGPGIPPDQQATVFDKYVQAGSKSHGRYHSAGLGLTFCKMAVETHGGTIGVDSQSGKGSTFWFTLPAA